MENKNEQDFGTLLKQAGTSVIKLLIWMFKWPFIILGLPAAVYFAQKWLAEQPFVWLQWVLVFIFIAFLIFLVGWIRSKGGIPAAFKELRRYGVLVPFIFAYNVLFSYISIFALLVFLLPHETFFVGEQNPSIGRLYDFFMWHFFEMIPVFDFPDTVLWKNKLDYVPNSFPDEEVRCSGPHIIGWILLIFKIIVVLPVISLIKLYFNNSPVKGQLQDQKPLSNKHYTLSIDKTQLSNEPVKRMQEVLDETTPVINQIITDAMTAALGNWSAGKNQQDHDQNKQMPSTDGSK